MRDGLETLICTMIGLSVGFVIGRAELTGKRLQLKANQKPKVDPKRAEAMKNRLEEQSEMMSSGELRYDINTARKITYDVENQLSEVEKYFEKDNIHARIVNNSEYQKQLTVMVTYNINNYRHVIVSQNYWYYKCKNNAVYEDLLEKIQQKLRILKG